MRSSSHYDVLNAAIRDITEHGFDSVERVEMWVERIKDSIRQTMQPPPEAERALRRVLQAVYRRYIDQGQILRTNFGADRFTLDKVRPQLRAELDRRIMASANLIRLNREEAVSNTLRRFQGWATSIPVGGSDAVKKPKVKADIKKSLVKIKFEERRVLIDQGHKLRASLSDILATDGGAIAAIWHSHYRELNYNYRPDHKERDGKVYLIRNSWARQRGLVKPDNAGYTDEITQPAEEVYCRCYYQYLYSIDRLPPDMVTVKGRKALEAIAA